MKTIKPKKSLGQNFLIDQNIINIITDVGKIDEKDVVLEVGPGTGNLTEKILTKIPKKLFVIEKDKFLAERLRKKFKEKLIVFNEDVLKIDEKKLSNEPMTVFGNLPYNVSTQILVKWIKLNNLNKTFKKFVLMFQKEVAERIIATTNKKNYGRLAILASWRMNIKKIADVSPNSFYPIPKVKSTILLFEPKIKYFNFKNSKNLEHITNIFFNQRRKMIKRPMKIIFKNFEEMAKTLSLDLTLRPQNLSKLTYYKICSYYEKLLK